MRARDNPFRSERVEALAYRDPGFAWDELLLRLKRQGGRGALSGPEGSGKTTLLHQLGDRLEAAGHSVRRLRPDLDDRRLAAAQLRRFAAGADPGTALLLDGADRLGTLAWWRLTRASAKAATLVVTTHSGGRLPTLHRCTTSAGLLGELVAELEPALARCLDTEALWAQSGGNVRLALRSLYDRAAGSSGGALEVPHFAEDSTS